MTHLEQIKREFYRLETPEKKGEYALRLRVRPHQRVHADGHSTWHPRYPLGDVSLESFTTEGLAAAAQLEWFIVVVEKYTKE